MTALPSPPRAALMLIGDELLSGKIRDENGYFLAKLLRQRGVQLVEQVTLADDPHVIARAFLRLSRGAKWIFSSGGVGPTHDDRTIEGIAMGLGRPLCRHPELQARLEEHYGERCSPEVLRMADLPQGARLYAQGRWPVTGVPYGLDAQGQVRIGDSHRIYILPGIPSLFAQKLQALGESPGDLPQGALWEREELELAGDESRFSAPLREIAAQFPQVDIGSYPKWERDAQGALRVRVRLTFESRVAGAAARARSAMIEAHPFPADESC